MRRVLLTATAMLCVLGLSGTAQAQNNVVRFTALLSRANETPPVLTGAFANAAVTLDLKTQTLSWTSDVFNMPSGTNNAHFHVGGPGLAGPTCVNVAFPAGISHDYNLSGQRTGANRLGAPAQ